MVFLIIACQLSRRFHLPCHRFCPYLANIADLYLSPRCDTDNNPTFNQVTIPARFVQIAAT